MSARHARPASRHPGVLGLRVFGACVVASMVGQLIDVQWLGLAGALMANLVLVVLVVALVRDYRRVTR